MANFAATLEMLQACYDNVTSESLSESEQVARYHLLIMCHEIADTYDFDDFFANSQQMP